MRCGLTQTVPPYTEPVSLAELKEWLRIDDADQDATLLSLARGARDYVEGATGRQLVAATWRLTLDGWPGSRRLRLPRAPLVSVGAVSYVDADGATQTWSSSLYRVDLTPTLGTVEPAYTEYWPTLRGVSGAVNVTFVAGHAAPFSVVAATDVLTVRGRTVADGDVFRLSNSGGALPAGLAADTDYYVVQTTGGTFKLSLTAGGAAVDVTGAGSGTHFLGEVPDGMKAAIKLLAAHWFRTREAVITGTSATEVPLAVQSLLMQHWTGELD